MIPHAQMLEIVTDEARTGEVSAEEACYAGPLTETTVREAADFLYAMRQSITERIMILEGEGRLRAAAAKARQINRLEEILREMEAALHNLECSHGANPKNQ